MNVTIYVSDAFLSIIGKNHKRVLEIIEKWDGKFREFPEEWKTSRKNKKKITVKINDRIKAMFDDLDKKGIPRTSALFSAAIQAGIGTHGKALQTVSKYSNEAKEKSIKHGNDAHLQEMASNDEKVLVSRVLVALLDLLHEEIQKYTNKILVSQTNVAHDNHSGIPNNEDPKPNKVIKKQDQNIAHNKKKAGINGENQVTNTKHDKKTHKLGADTCSPKAKIKETGKEKVFISKTLAAFLGSSHEEIRKRANDILIKWDGVARDNFPKGWIKNRANKDETRITLSGKAADVLNRAQNKGIPKTIALFSAAVQAGIGSRPETKKQHDNIIDEYRLDDTPYTHDQAMTLLKKVMKIREEAISKITEIQKMDMKSADDFIGDEADIGNMEMNSRNNNMNLHRVEKILKEAESALERFRNGSYGWCEETGEPIDYKRMLANPLARFTIEVQEKKEKLEKLYA